jgi:4-amino-4-deoxy-L-arabinose transferase-like glycosyltransferase
MNRNKIILLAILILAAFLRFYRLDSYPALNADEAAIGYNAYSLLQTGKDEHGNSWPIHFQSFNDYKPGLYFYLVLPFVGFLGLNEWAVRIPGALMGVGTVLAIYLLTKELFPKEKQFSILNFKFSIGEIAAFFLAISPWHIHFSRGGWETNAATLFITVGVWLFLKAIKKVLSIKYLVLSMLAFVASLYTYHAARIIVPLLLLGMVLVYRNKIRKNLGKVIKAALIGVILLVPLGLDLTKGAVFSRAAGVGLFADPGPLNRINEQRGEHEDFKSLAAVILHNKPVNYGLAFLENWSEHFWGEFLFLSGDEIQRNKIPETGQMYLQDFILLIVGVAAMVKWLKRKKVRLILWWLVVAPTAAALTFQSPHALRAHNMVIPLVIISAYGLVKIIECLEKLKQLRVLGYVLLGVLVFWSFARYERMYWLHMAKEYPYSSQYGLKELVAYVQEREGRYEKIIVTDRYDQPYILFLFYKKYPPAKFQLEHELTSRDKFGFSTVRNFDKYYFQEINFDEIRPSTPNSLIIGTDEEIPDEANIIERIYFPNGNVAFEIVEN